jgi:hypothetical protein
MTAIYLVSSMSSQIITKGRAASTSQGFAVMNNRRSPAAGGHHIVTHTSLICCLEVTRRHHVACETHVAATFLVIAKNAGGIRPIAAHGLRVATFNRKGRQQLHQSGRCSFAGSKNAWLRCNKRSKDCRPSSKMLRRQHAAEPVNSEKELQECS